MTIDEARANLEAAERDLQTIWRGIYQGGATEAANYRNTEPALDAARKRFDAACAAWVAALPP